MVQTLPTETLPEMLRHDVVKPAVELATPKPAKQDLWDTVVATLDEVAVRLKLDPGIHAILRHGLSRPTFERSGALQRWHPLSPGCQPERGQGSIRDDDMEVRGGGDSFRWSQGRDLVRTDADVPE
jgi:hypothetical protein